MTLALPFNPESLGLMQSSYFNSHYTFFFKCLEPSSVKLSTQSGSRVRISPIRTGHADGKSVGIWEEACLHVASMAF